MTLTGHRYTGTIIAGWFVALTWCDYPFWVSLVSGYMVILGSVAPDKLEFSRYQHDSYFKRTSIIPHRTYTHWLALWFVLLLSGLALKYFINFYFLLLVGYAVGGLWHLLGDLPNPTGIPIFHPYKRRKSLKWWKSGEMEGLIFALMLLGSVAAIFLFYPFSTWQSPMVIWKSILMKVLSDIDVFRHNLTLILN